MTDAELRGAVLRWIYDKRKVGLVNLSPGDIPGIEGSELQRICLQLLDQGLLKWSLTSIAGHGQITAFGADVVEGKAQSPISITLDQSISVQGSSNVQIGNANVQQNFIDIDRLVTAINSSNASDAAKQEAQSLLTRFLEHPVVAAIVGALAGRVGGP